jgi:hypothetical protein
MSTGAESRYSIAGRDQALDLTAHYPGHPEQGRHLQVGDDGFEARPHTAGFRSAHGTRLPLAQSSTHGCRLARDC